MFRQVLDYYAIEMKYLYLALSILCRYPIPGMFFIQKHEYAEAPQYVPAGWVKLRWDWLGLAWHGLAWLRSGSVGLTMVFKIHQGELLARSTASLLALHMLLDNAGAMASTSHVEEETSSDRSRGGDPMRRPAHLYLQVIGPAPSQEKVNTCTFCTLSLWFLAELSCKLLLEKR